MENLKFHNMKKLSTLLLALMMMVSGVTFAQTKGAAKAKPATTTQAAPKEKASPEAKPAAAPMKKDGTPDKRYKANKKLKSDGTPDKRYKENKTTAAPAK